MIFQLDSACVVQKTFIYHTDIYELNIVGKYVCASVVTCEVITVLLLFNKVIQIPVPLLSCFLPPLSFPSFRLCSPKSAVIEEDR